MSKFLCLNPFDEEGRSRFSSVAGFPSKMPVEFYDFDMDPKDRAKLIDGMTIAKTDPDLGPLPDVFAANPFGVGFSSKGKSVVEDVLANAGYWSRMRTPCGQEAFIFFPGPFRSIREATVKFGAARSVSGNMCNLRGADFSDALACVPVFKLTEFWSFTFFSESFVRLMQESGLSGTEFKEFPSASEGEQNLKSSGYDIYQL